MSAFDKRISIDDIKIGAVLWDVFCTDGTYATAPSVFQVVRGPYKNTTTGSLMYEGEGVDMPKSRGKTPTHFYEYLDDVNVRYEGSNTEQYNFHAQFKNEEDALMYVAEINEKRLSPELKSISAHIIKCDELFKTLDWYPHD